MPLTSNTTVNRISKEIGLRQQNSACIFVDSTAEKMSKIWAYCVVLLRSFLGNIFIITIVYKQRELHKTVNYFIVNMAVSDLVFPLMVIPVHVTGLVTDSWHWRVGGILGLILCKLLYFSSPSVSPCFSSKLGVDSN